MFDDEEDSKTIYTATDALTCKFSAVHAGYIHNCFYEPMFNAKVRKPIASCRKPPIINRGYFARMETINIMVKSFLVETVNVNRQILILGAGFDILPMSLSCDEHASLKFFEVDFAQVITKKATLIAGEPEFSRVGDIQKTSWGCTIGHSLTMVAHDLRNSASLIETLTSSGFDVLQPTLVLSECVMVYMPKQDATNLVTALGQALTEAVWISYDMINPTDRFGQTMVRNLARAGFVTPGFTDFPTLEAQCARYLQTGWARAQSCTMLKAFDRMIAVEEKTRINRLEMLDEVEEWQLLMSHYSLTVALQGAVCAAVVELLPR